NRSGLDERAIGRRTADTSVSIAGVEPVLENRGGGSARACTATSRASGRADGLGSMQRPIRRANCREVVDSETSGRCGSKGGGRPYSGGWAIAPSAYTSLGAAGSPPWRDSGAT